MLKCYKNYAVLFHEGIAYFHSPGTLPVVPVKHTKTFYFFTHPVHRALINQYPFAFCQSSHQSVIFDRSYQTFIIAKIAIKPF